MSDLLDTINKITAYTQALTNGVTKLAEALPVVTRQHINTLANRQLQTSKTAYMDALDIRYKDYALIVEIDEDNWLANAVESGASAFDIKEGLIKSPKAKVSSKGFRYMHVPMQKDPNSTPGTEKGEEYQEAILNALSLRNFGLSSLRSDPSGGVMEMQKIFSEDPKASGLYRTRKFSSAKDYYSGKSRPQWQYIMFRTVSENPVSKTNAQWEHPGIQGKGILRQAERWLYESIPTLLESFIEEEFKRLYKGNT